MFRTTIVAEGAEIKVDAEVEVFSWVFFRVVSPENDITRKSSWENGKVAIQVVTNKEFSCVQDKEVTLLAEEKL